MTVGGDLCASAYCSDLALPGRDLCSGCLADLQAERAERDVETARLTADHERRITNQDEATA